MNFINEQKKAEAKELQREKSREEVKKFKVKELDWYDVETRMRQVCQSMLNPVADLAG